MKNLKKTLLAAALLNSLSPASTIAEDIDIYAATTSPATYPNILVVIDSSANWSSNAQHWPDNLKQGQSELSALRTVIGELGTNVNLGMMLFTEGSSATNPNGPGGYVRYHLRPMTATNKTAFQALLGNPAGCTDGPNSLNGTPNCIYQNFDHPSEKVGTAKTDYSAVMFEVFKYFGGYTGPANALTDIAGSPVDASHFGATRYAGAPDTKSDPAAYSTDVNKTNYNPPLSGTNSCAKNFVIFIGNGFPTQDSPSSLLSEVGGDISQLALPEYTTASGNIESFLTTGNYSSQAACEAAAASTYGVSYDSYRCAAIGESTTSVVLNADTGCGTYSTVSACRAAAASMYPGYTSYSCDVTTTNCAGVPTNLGLSTCGQYVTQAECEADISSRFPGFVGGYQCSVNTAGCNPTTDSFGTSTCGQYRTATDCQAALAISQPGYASYSCTTAVSGCTTDFSSLTCFANDAACASSAQTSNPGYNSFACSGGDSVACNGIWQVCGDVNTYKNQTDCNTDGALRLPGYDSYACSQTTSSDICGGGNNRYWTITGKTTRQRFSTITGTGTTWNMSGTSAGGTIWNRVGIEGPSFQMSGHTTFTTYNIYGTRQITSASPTGSFVMPTTSNISYADEWARFLRQTDVNEALGQQNITTYTIDVFKDAQDHNQTMLLLGMARAGGGKYFTASDEGAIRDALRRIFAEIQSVNSVFASSSLPVSVNTQGTYLNQVFMGMFRPDGQAKPRWAGNLKQYHFKIFSGRMLLADKMDQEAISSTTGFITPCATSFWTTDTGDYWTFAGTDSAGTCTAETSAYPSPGSSSAYSDLPDGDVVEKGGAAQRLRGVTLNGTPAVVTSTNYATRNIKTCDGSSATSCTAFTSFDTANASLTGTAFGIPTGTEAEFVDWVRGKDVYDEDGDTVLTEMRPSAHGGVIHSQPAVVDYGGATGVIAFYGADDGILHAVDGGQTDAEGTELWGFIAPETYMRLNRLRDNGTTTPLVSFPGVLGSVAPKDYFFDGALSVYQKSGTTWLFAGMRRGGRALYAFNISDPYNPTLKWRRGCFTNQTTNNTMCSTGWSNIGQTWSRPTIAYIRGYVASGVRKPVLVFGGGYDTCEDYDGPDPYNQTPANANCTSTTVHKGSQVWIVDADTGNIIRTYPTSSSVPADVSVVTDFDGYMTQIYASDINGDLYRINVGTYNGTSFATGPVYNWSTTGAYTGNTLLAQLATTTQPRKFFSAPNVVQYSGYNAVMIGSGDREHPLGGSYACKNFSADGTPVTNWFYMIKDNPATVLSSGNGYPITHASVGLVDVTSGGFTESQIIDGWKFSFGLCEQSVNNPLTIAGTTYFGTNAPLQTTVGSCQANLGASRGYAVDFLTGNAIGSERSAPFLGGGMPPSPVAGVVDVDGHKLPFIIGGIDVDQGSQSALQGTDVVINPAGPRKRVYWFQKNID